MLTIRPATETDVPAIAALARQLNEHQGDPAEHFTAKAVRRDGFGEAPQFWVLLAEWDGTPIGYALFHDAYDTCFAARGLYLCDLFVEAGARRHGAGRALVAAVAQVAKRRDKSFVWWASKAWNAEAQGFYRALGAVEEPVIAHAIHGAPFDRLATEGADLPRTHGGDVEPETR